MRAVVQDSTAGQVTAPSSHALLCGICRAESAWKYRSVEWWSMDTIFMKAAKIQTLYLLPLPCNDLTHPHTVLIELSEHYQCIVHAVQQL